MSCKCHLSNKSRRILSFSKNIGNVKSLFVSVISCIGTNLNINSPGTSIDETNNVSVSFQSLFFNSVSSSFK